MSNAEESKPLWEGSVFVNARANAEAKARVIPCDGMYLDPLWQMGKDLKFQIWHEDVQEWRAASPYTVSAVSLVMALVEANQPKR